MTSIAGWVISDIAFSALLGVIVGILYMLVRITTPNHRNNNHNNHKERNHD